jgi:fructokinase
MKKTILAFGEVLWDILPSCTVLGGAPFNFVYRVNSLGDTGLMVSRLGRDELGRKAFDQVVQLGLDTAYIQWDE